MTFDDLDADAVRLGESVGFSVQLETTQRRGFDGGETVTLVISVLASGLVGGALSSAGGDLWTGMKTLLGKALHAKRADTCQVVVIHRVGDHVVRYVCQVDGPADVDRLARAMDRAVGGAGGTERSITLILVGDDWTPVT